MAEPAISPTRSDETAPEAPEQSVARVAPTVGCQLGRYCLVRALGEGGMGAVFEAVHEDIGRRVAIKVLLPALSVRQNPRERFFREARAAARVHHPGVVQVHDVAVDHGTPYLVMDLLKGETLAQRLARGPIPESELLRLMVPALEGVACAHAAGVIHRDLKPSNIFLERRSDGDRAVVVDFGVSRLTDEDSDLTGALAVLGTPAFMSPEQALGARDLDAASDQFSLGAVLFMCLSGRRPFDGETPLQVISRVQRGEREALSTAAPGASRAIVAVIERAMSREPSARFASVRDFVTALERSALEPHRHGSFRRIGVTLGALSLASLFAWGSLRAKPSAARLHPASRPSAPALVVSVPERFVAPPAPTIPEAPATVRASVARPTAVPVRAAARSRPTAPSAVAVTSTEHAAPEAPPATPEAPEEAPAALAIGPNRALILGR